VTALILPVATGCISTAPTPVNPTFHGPLSPQLPQADPSEYSAFLSGGAGTLDGQVFLTTRGGEVRVGAGQTVTLDPLTQLGRSWLSTTGVYVERFNEVPNDTLFRRTHRTTTVDAQGNFHFSNLHDGLYAARSVVTWMVGSDPQGGLVVDTVRISSGSAPRLMLHSVVDPATAENIHSDAMVEIVASEQLSRPHHVLRSEAANSCRSQTDALLNLRKTAKTGGGAALMNVLCQSHTNVLDNTSCATTFRCLGDVVVWG
jgi:hypothetical protein